MNSMRDLNWLFSACAQSGAAIVAIIGGFLVSRLISLSAERNGLKTRLEEIRNRGQLARQSENKAQAELVSWRAAEFAYDVRDDLYDSGGDASTDQLMRKYDTRGLTEEELSPVAMGARASIKEAISFFQKHPIPPNPDLEFDKFVEEVGKEISEEKRDAFELVYYEERHKEIERSGDTFIPVDYMYPAVVSRSRDEAAMKRSQYEILTRNYDSAVRQRLDMEAQRLGVENRLIELGKPQGLASGLLVLFYLCVVGVILPLSLLPVAPEASSERLKWTVLGFFFSGLFGLFLYFVIAYLGLQTRLIQSCSRPGKIIRKSRSRFFIMLSIPFVILNLAQSLLKRLIGKLLHTHTTSC